MRRSLTAAVMALAAHIASSAACAEPPAAGTGYGAYQRTVEGLPEVQFALIEDDGTIFAALGSGGVVRVSAAGERSTIVPWWPAGGVAVAGPMARLRGGGILVVDMPRAQLIAVAPDGTRTLLTDLSELSIPPRPVALCTEGEDILVADGAQPRVLVLDSNGTAKAQWDIPPAKKGTVAQLRGIAASPDHVFVSDAANNRIVRLNRTTGAVTAEWGDRGVQRAMFHAPSGLAWDGVGLVVTDTLNHRVVRFDADGTLQDQWGMHAVRPREGEGKIHYPVSASPSPNGTLIAVAEPFERRVQVFGHKPPPDPTKPTATPLPANDGLASHFSREVAVDGQTLLVYEPESASALVFDMRNEPPIHVTTLGGPGHAAGQFGHVTTQLVDEKANRLYLVDPVRGVIVVYALRRDGQAPHYDAFMGRLVGETPLAAAAAFAAHRAGGPSALWPVDIVRTPSGGFALLDALGGRVVELDSALRPVNAWVAKRGPSRLVNPTQMAITPQGEVVIVDSAERALKRYTLNDGAFQGATAVPEIKRPWGVAVLPDPTGSRLAVTDAGGDALLIVDPTKNQIVTRKVGTGGRPGEMWEPSAVAFQSADGRLYMSDHGNHRLQSFLPDGTWESTFGLGRPYVRPRDPNAPQAPSAPVGTAPSAEGAANTLSQFPVSAKGADGWWTAASTDGKFALKWRAIPAQIPLRDPFALEVVATDRHTGQPTDAQLSIGASMPHHGHGMNVAPTVTREGAGKWKVENMLFHMPGYWEIYFDLIGPDRLERAQAEVTLE